MCYRSDDYLDLGGTIPFRVAEGYDGYIPVPVKKLKITVNLGPEAAEAKTEEEDVDESR